jgi:NAD-dependent DNA ligase
MPTITCNGKEVELIRPTYPEPTACPFCGGEVGRNETKDGPGAITMCLDPSCPIKQDKKLKSWIGKTKILQIGDSIREAMREQLGIYTAADLYKLGREIGADEFSEIIISGNSKLGRNAEVIIDEIDKKRDLPLHIFLGSLGINALGRREVQIACQKAPNALGTLADWRSGKLRNVGFAASINAPTKADKWADSIDDMADIIDGLLANGVTCQDAAAEVIEPVGDGGVLAGKVFVFTGAIQRVDDDGKRFTRDMMQAKAREHSAEIDKKIKQSTSEREYVLVQADPTSVSSKTKQAQAKNAQIISEAQFWSMIGE